MLSARFLRRLLVASLVLISVAGPVQAAGKNYQRSIVKYTMPDVVLVNQNGTKVRFRRLIETDKTVVVDFIYGTCTTICPVLSAGFANLQRKLGADSRKIHLISISIDPEHDTPQVMNEYLKNFRARPGWDFLSGSREDIDRVMKAFDAYFPTKMSHRPLDFIKAPSSSVWVRLDGLMGTGDLMSEMKKAGAL